LEGSTNNYVELMALKILMKLAADKEVKKLQVFGDSDLFMHWMKGCYRMGNMNLHFILAQMQNMETLFSNISYHHVYRELNTQQMVF